MPATAENGWRTPAFEAGRHLIAFDEAALLLLELWRRRVRIADRWNFRHLVNVKTRRAVHAVNLRLGYPLIEIVSPEEV